MNVFETDLSGVVIIEPDLYSDTRGFFKETFQERRFTQVGIAHSFVQQNHSRSRIGVIRGLHFQRFRPQGKLVSCIRGSVYDVVVDVTPSSSTFGQYVGVELSEKNHLQLWIPPGYAHGFCVLDEIADIQYMCTDFYFPEYESGLIWNDPDVGIKWPIESPCLSEKDSSLPRLRDIQGLVSCE